MKFPAQMRTRRLPIPQAASVIGFAIGLAIVIYLVKPIGGYSLSFIENVTSHFLDEWGSYFWAAVLSALVIVIGTIIGFVLGFAIAVSVFCYPRARAAVTPIIAFLAPMPIVVWIPFSIGLMGVGMTHVILIVVVGAMFTFYMYCLEALQDIPRSTRDVFDIHGRGGVGRTLLLYLPAWIEASRRSTGFILHLHGLQ